MESSTTTSSHTQSILLDIPDLDAEPLPSYTPRIPHRRHKFPDHDTKCASGCDTEHSKEEDVIRAKIHHAKKRSVLLRMRKEIEIMGKRLDKEVERGKGHWDNPTFDRVEQLVLAAEKCYDLVFCQTYLFCVLNTEEDFQTVIGKVKTCVELLVLATGEFEYVLEDFHLACRALRLWIQELKVLPPAEGTSKADKVQSACVHGVFMHDWWLGKKVDSLIQSLKDHLTEIEEVVKSAGIWTPLHCYTCVEAGLELDRDGTRRKRWLQIRARIAG